MDNLLIRKPYTTFPTCSVLTCSWVLFVFHFFCNIHVVTAFSPIATWTRYGALMMRDQSVADYNTTERKRTDTIDREDCGHLIGTVFINIALKSRVTTFCLCFGVGEARRYRKLRRGCNKMTKMSRLFFLFFTSMHCFHARLTTDRLISMGLFKYRIGLFLSSINVLCSSACFAGVDTLSVLNKGSFIGALHTVYKS
jgi:hypothetical protein